MDNLNSILSHSKFNSLIKGDWYVVQWSPNRSIGEVVNIGVVFKEAVTNEFSIQMLDYFERVNCLYSKDMQFHAELACNVARELMFSCDIDLDNDYQISSQIRIIKKGFAQGKSHDEILNQLYVKLIPLGRRSLKKTKSEFITKSRDSIYNNLKSKLKINLELDYNFHVPEDPYQNINYDNVTHNLFIPYRKHTGVATLVSAAYLDVQRVKCNIFDGYRDVDISSSKFKTSDNAIFLMLPEFKAKKSIQIEVENEIDKFGFLLKKHGIYVATHSNSDLLAEEISEWCLTEKVA